MVVALLVAFIGLAFAEPTAVQLQTRNPVAQSVLNKALLEQNYWKDASTSTYKGKQFDEIRLKELSSGYVAMISGEGDKSYRHNVVADIVFSQQDRIPQHTEGAKAVVTLGTGKDARNGMPYTDTFFYLDMGVFYATYVQRMYRRTDETGRTVLWYESLDQSFVDKATWQKYQSTIATTKENVKRRAILSSVVPVGDIYGMFIVEKGHTLESRVTFITKLVFGEDAGWVARWGSQLPPVIKAGLKSGFRSCVAIADAEQKRRG